MLPALFLNSPKTSVSVPRVSVGPHTNAATFNNLPEELLASIILVIQSGQDICTEVRNWLVVNRQWKCILDRNDFWVSVLEQHPFNWRHYGTLGGRNADQMWDTGMTARAFFQMICGLKALQRKRILELTTTTTTIGGSAFTDANLSGLTSLPPGLTTIGNEAFGNANLSGLTSLPPGLTTTDYGAFMSANLIGLTLLPPGLTTIGFNAFADANLSGLTSLPPGLTTIQEYAFFGSNLSSLTLLPPHLTTIEYDAFRNANLSSLTSLPLGLTTILDGAFFYANLSRLTSLPPGMTIESLQMHGADLSGLSECQPI